MINRPEEISQSKYRIPNMWSLAVLLPATATASTRHKSET